MPQSAVHTRTIEIPAAVYESFVEYSKVAGVSIDAAIAEAMQDFVDVQIEARLG